MPEPQGAIRARRATEMSRKLQALAKGHPVTFSSGYNNSSTEQLVFESQASQCTLHNVRDSLLLTTSIKKKMHTCNKHDHNL